MWKLLQLLLFLTTYYVVYSEARYNFFWGSSSHEDHSFEFNPDHINKCYDRRGYPKRCVPDFENIAFEKPIVATNTCGISSPTKFCVTKDDGQKTCDVCDTRDPTKAHPPSHLTDSSEIYWQSETMNEGISQVNLTLNLGKAFQITYIRLRFQSPRPHSMAIYRRQTTDGPWLHWQYYSVNCTELYGLPDENYIAGGAEDRPLCTSDFSSAEPSSGGDILFQTLEGRPSAYDNFEGSVYEKFVEATDIMFTLDKMNVDEGAVASGDKMALRSSFYAIMDISVGGRCICNGHSHQCVNSLTKDGKKNGDLVCDCQHNTEGVDCQKCKPFYNDQPWGKAGVSNPYECKPCNCNGFSEECYFDEALHKSTGHGGHCVNCTGNRDGVNCERCKEGFSLNDNGNCTANAK